MLAVLCYFGVTLLISNQDEIAGAAEFIGRPNIGWLLVAILAEILSYVTYAAAQRRVAIAEGHPLGLTRLSLLAVAAQAIGVCIPGGYAWSNVFSYRILRRWQLDEVSAGRLLVVTATVYVAALAVLAVIGAQVAGGNGPVGDVRIVAYSTLAVIAVVLGLIFLRPRLVRAALVRAIDAIDGLVIRRKGHPAKQLERLRTTIRDAEALGRGVLGWAALWLMLAWLTDIACLVAAFGAVGSSPPWQGLLLAYSAGQLAALLPVTPGGLGVVEGSLTFALVSFGGAQERTVAAVLLYRLISFWGLIPAGAACYGALRLRFRGVDPAAIEVAPG